jgi:hypothetical protein
MKVTSLALALSAAVFMVVAVAPIQAACFNKQPGWHMVSKRCDIKSARDWQVYTSGVYIQPMVQRGFPFLGR